MIVSVVVSRVPSLLRWLLHHSSFSIVICGTQSRIQFGAGADSAWYESAPRFRFTADTQTLSQVGTTTNNVHTDACFFDSGRSQKLDEPASFASRGVGVISACPDPDGTGPKVSILSVDKKRCFQSGYQDNGLTGNDEFHARMNNDGTPGMQRVVWCYDPENNGCADSRVKRDTRINWVA